MELCVERKKKEKKKSESRGRVPNATRDSAQQDPVHSWKGRVPILPIGTIHGLCVKDNES